ncbi:hypothetical protein HC251_06790 [Iamia sp. SCSIO 61187]|uniref:hypothetical protein n=1 Tax=Iamia sp. SCSIO 61187 TaxID=2722752 RepID=UPI001C639C99|nr:hypothetical protein [Iamia sp. SCSIO 61187]QYG92176.1 hypothetical protein HC251_06790 [Iamia sp. SCSIO 61187]
MAGRIEAWRHRQEQRARERAARLRVLDGRLRTAVETREIPRPARAPLPAPGELPAEVAALVDDGQVLRAVTLLANLTGASPDGARAAVAAYVHRDRA